MNENDRSAVLKRVFRDIRSLVDEYPGLTHTWRFAASAVWAMGRYYAADGAQPPPAGVAESEYVEDTKKNIDGLIENNEFSPDWQRGFWFNTAIVRLDALWERLFKLLVTSGDEGKGPTLYDLVRSRSNALGGMTYGDSSFGQVRQIVNQLKHETGGAHPSIRENRELPMRTIEDLFAVIKDEAFRSRLVSIGEGPVLVGRTKRH